jgi:hypothetical protein
MSDASVLIATTAAKKLVDAIDFPLQLQIPPGRSSAGLGEAELTITAGDGPLGDDEMPEISGPFEAFIGDMAKRAMDGTLDARTGNAEQLAALKVIGKTLAQKGEGALYAKGADEVKKALGVLITKASVSFEVQWVKVQMDRPTVLMANPITASKIGVYVQARVKACIRIFGRRVCVTVTSPRIRLEARAATLSLSGAGPRVMAQPAFKDLDIVIRIRIWKWTFSIRIGITGLVNEQLRRQGPILVADLAALEQDIPYSRKKLVIASFAFATDPKGLLIDASMKVQ